MKNGGGISEGITKGTTFTRGRSKPTFGPRKVCVVTDSLLFYIDTVRDPNVKLQRHGGSNGRAIRLSYLNFMGRVKSPKNGMYLLYHLYF